MRRLTFIVGLVTIAAAGPLLLIAADCPNEAAASPRPHLVVNQLGYLPDAPKRATLMTLEQTPVDWQLIAADGSIVARGRTRAVGIDPTSRRNVHIIDFSAVNAQGDRFHLRSSGEKSRPFAIATGIYRPLARDAVDYFYPVRSGIAVDGAIAGEAYARPAGHTATSAEGQINKGDRDVSCLPAKLAAEAYGEPWTCSYRLDVTGGWYDAGDHGKYVVNGGISAAQLMQAYERSLHVEGAAKDLYADGSLALPETGNGVPDILDEVRWELEFLLRMQVPEGNPLAGMAHHKVHDDAWTGLPLLPHEDPRPRYLHHPSTAATLNLAAAAAQGERLFEPYDPTFSRSLLHSAERAWRAAVENPALLAPASDNQGGGAYDDADVEDEFFWAAAELFITTGKQEYRDAVAASRFFESAAFGDAGFDWANVAALGTLSVGLVPNGLTTDEIARQRGAVVEAAEAYLARWKDRAFGQLYAPEDGKYGWGSNHLMAQIGTILARAYDYTGDTRFKNAAIEGADYLLGRNALGQSYITGYGTDYSTNQHSRWFARQLDPALPAPPDGALAGGPNAYLQDEAAKEARSGCAPQECYLDDIQSWSTNEITINWNAALAQYAAFLAEQ
ncbi:glycoside hydrolase family 9 protein [Nitratireductor luteus]|uniref:glycoside hydrolase family 9 protein n=1 Tax=Nitratireductor luteus TaxID=2976980 RepID=UPI0022403477|nr:glycoside hydrolase family 9 protein [Nitratireductor luteus]